MKKQLFSPEDPACPRPLTLSHGAPKPLLSVEETAELLGQSRSSIYRAIEKDDLPLPVFRIAGRYRIPRRAVELLLDGIEVKGTQVSRSLPPAG